MPTIEQLQNLLAAEPDDVFLNFGLAMQLARAGRLDDAARQFERVIRLDPKYIAAYLHWGKMLIGAGRHADAREILSRGAAVAEAAGDRHARDEMRSLALAIPP